VNEAITLADRILVMGKDPGRIRDDIPVDLPRPRKREENEFLLFSRKLHEALRD
jgi:NitT/TauT family transport system ATP-binding protein